VPADQLLHCAVGAEAWQLDGVVALNQAAHVIKRQAALGCRTTATTTTDTTGQQGVRASKRV
jgi:hypothetical protein